MFPFRYVCYLLHFTGDGKGELCHLKFRTLKYQQMWRQLLVVWNNNTYLQKPSLLFYLYLNYVTSKNTVWKEGHISVHILSPPSCIWVYKIHLRVRNQMVIMASEGTSHMQCSVVSSQYSLFISSVTIHSLLISSELKTEQSFNPILLLSSMMC